MHGHMNFKNNPAVFIFGIFQNKECIKILANSWSVRETLNCTLKQYSKLQIKITMILNTAAFYKQKVISGCMVN